MYYIIKKKIVSINKTRNNHQNRTIFYNFFIIFTYEVEKHIILSVFIQSFIFSKNQKGLLLFIFKHDTLLLMLIISNPLN